MKNIVPMLAAIALACPAVAHAAAQIDVDNLIVGPPSTGRLVSTAFAGGMMQTWTATTTGRLTQIDMFTMAYYNGDPSPDPSERAVLEIYDAGSFESADFEQNIAAATLLGTASLPMDGRPNGSQVSAVQTFLLSALNIDVQQDQRLAFRMLGQCSPCSANASYWVNWTALEGPPFINSNGYAGGGHFNPVGAPGLYAATGADLNFRTWVDPSAAGAIPEPASWAMLIAGFGLVGAMGRRRRKARARVPHARMPLASGCTTSAIAIGLIAATPATAAQFVLNVSGNLQTNPAFDSDQTDRLGLFGAPGRLLAGLPFQASFRLDPSELVLMNAGASNGPARVFSSGLNPFYARGEAILGQITIDGRTIRNIGATTNPFAPAFSTVPGTGSEQQLAISEDGGRDSFNLFTGSSANTPGEPLTIGGITYPARSFRLQATVATFARDFTPPGFALQEFDIAASDPGVTTSSTGGQFAVQGIGGLDSYYYLRITNATFSELAVPEPDSWALLIAGFGITGAVARRRRAQRVVTA